MTKYLEFPLESGGAILIESADDEAKTGAGFMRGDPTTEAAKQAKQSFDAALENVRHSADLLVSKLRGLSQPPDEMEVNFSLKASGEFGNLAIGNVGGEANYSVRLVWRRDKPEKKDEGEGKPEN